VIRRPGLADAAFARILQALKPKIRSPSAARIPLMDRPSEEIPQLTGLRAVAALMVLLHHLNSISGNLLSFRFSPVDEGFLGVDIFFVLSGFILSHVYAHWDWASPRAYGMFLWRRLARIYPLHLAVLVALIAMVAPRGLLNTNLWEVADLPRHVLLLQAWTWELTWNLPSWSISAEWAAYLAFPLAVQLILRPARLLLPLLLVAALLVGFQILGIARSGIWGSWLGWAALSRIAAEFALGVLGFRLVQGLPHSPRWDLVAAAAFCAVFLLPSGLLQILSIGVLVPAIGVSAGWVQRLLGSRVLGSRVLVALGVISYAIYMVHFPAIKVIQYLADRLGFGDHPSTIAHVMFLTAAVGLVLLLAAAAYWTIERPARRWCRNREHRLFADPRPLAL
jgi:peptidoglycan/LPS O-acetylase OafA/YrhL